MTSLLKSFKQVPVNAGYFVCISGGSAALFGVDNSGNPSATIPTTPATPTLGAQYIDLGVNRYVKTTSGALLAGMYRKVVAVTSPLVVSGAEKFILIGGASSVFARMG